MALPRNTGNGEGEKNVSDLIISNENNEPGFRHTRWQQRKFLQNVREKKIKKRYVEVARMLLDAGASPNNERPQQGRHVVSEASQGESTQ